MRTAPYVDVRQCTVTYGAGRQRNATCHTNRARAYCARLRTTTQCVCERCRRSQRARLQRRRTSTYVNVRRRTQRNCTRSFAVVVLTCLTCTSISRCFQVILTISCHNIRLVTKTSNCVLASRIAVCEILVSFRFMSISGWYYRCYWLHLYVLMSDVFMLMSYLYFVYDFIINNNKTPTVLGISEKGKNMCKMPWFLTCTTIQYKLATNYNLSTSCNC